MPAAAVRRMAMLGRAQVVDILVHRGVQETVAWDIVVSIGTDYFDAMDEAAVQGDVNNVIWGFVEQNHEFTFRGAAVSA
jgi:hypothetical protein